MEGNRFDCSLPKDPREIDYEFHIRQQYVVLFLDKLYDFNPERSIRSLRNEYEMIQRLRRIENKRNNVEEKRPLPTLEEAERETVKRHLKRHRPDTSYKEIAEMLGITYQTLKRKKDKYNIDL